MTKSQSKRYRWYPPRDTQNADYCSWHDRIRWFLHKIGQIKRNIEHETELIDAKIQAINDTDDITLDKSLDEYRRIIRHNARKNNVLPREIRIEAMSLIAVTAHRTLGIKPYSVQILASLGMNDGYLVQMSAGEGKTLSIALSAVLQGWTGRICHIVTANDYLAQRDAKLMAPLYSRCGLRVASVEHDTCHDELEQRYASDIVYGTGKQILADFLRDQILLRGANDHLRRLLWELQNSYKPRKPVMRGLYAAIVDEADSVLIDDATTPLIISAAGSNPMLLESVEAARDIVDKMYRGKDYTIDERYRDVKFTEDGELKLNNLTKCLSPIWQAPERRNDIISQAIIARDLFQRDRHYVIEEEKIIIVDENTGRMMPGRSWSYGLHQAIEAREKVEVTCPARTLARMSFQHFFRLYRHLSGASGTLQGIRHELWITYRLLTLTIPPRLPSKLRIGNPYHFGNQQEKWNSIIETVLDLHKKNLPVLLGTRRISDSENLMQALQSQGVKCNVLNAKQHEHEAEVIKNAGEFGCITVATNMAGRGTDIILTPEVAKQGGLQVLMFEAHDSARVDMQLFGRSGRQGALGKALPFIALDDDLLRKQLPFLAKPLWWLAHIPSIRGFLIRLMRFLAQHKAQRYAWKIRQNLRSHEKLLNDRLSFAGNQDLAADLLDKNF